MTSPSPEPFHGESDIVERLRAKAGQIGPAPDTLLAFMTGIRPLILESAAEIERLREDVARITDERDGWKSEHSTVLDDVAGLIQRHKIELESLLAAAWENAAKIAEAKALEFLSPEYATGQPFSSFSERFACEQVAAALRAAGKEVSERNSTQKDGSR